MLPICLLHEHHQILPDSFHRQTTTFHKVQNHSPTCLPLGWIKSLLLLFRRRKAVT